METVRPSATPTTSPEHTSSETGTQIESSPGGFSPEFAISSDLRRVLAGPQALNPGTIRRLQRTIGNKSVQRLLQGHKPVTAAQASPPNVIQRFRETYNSQSGQTWEAIAIMHGFNSATRTPKMTSFVDSNRITWTKLKDPVPSGTVVRLPANVRAVTTPTVPTVTPTPTPSGPPSIPAQAELGTVLSAIGGFLDWAVPKPGDKYTFELGFRVPVGGGIFLGLKLSGEAERDDADPTSGVAPLKLDAKLGIDGKASYTFLYYGQIDFGASLVRNIKAESKRGGTGVMEALSFGLYRSVQETSYIPGRIMNWIWGSDRETWSARTAGRIAAADDKAFVGYAGGASAGAKSSKTVTGEETSEMGVEVAVSTGTEYSKDSIENQGTDNGTGGYTGTTTAGWFGSTESSLGESKTTTEVTYKVQVLGTEASIKVAREGTEWGLEIGVSVGTFSKIEGENVSEKAANLVEAIKKIATGIGGKLSEWTKTLGETVKLSRAAKRNVTSVASMIAGTTPSKDQFALVLYQGTQGPSTALVPSTGGGLSSGLTTPEVPKTLELPASQGWYNVDEGKFEVDAKFSMAIKANLSKREVSFGVDVNLEGGFDSSALTIKGSKSKRIHKWQIS